MTNEIRIGNHRVVDGKLVVPLDQRQRDILGRGVVAELEVARLEGENLALRDQLAAQATEIAAIRTELEALTKDPGDDGT